jgi:hypothetical protein
VECAEVTIDRWVVERISAFERVFCKGNPFALCMGYTVKWNEDLGAEVKAVILYFEDDKPKMEILDVDEVLSEVYEDSSYSKEINLDQSPWDVKRETFINLGIHHIKNGDEIGGDGEWLGRE